MTQIIIDNKKYVLLPEKEYKTLQSKAGLAIKPEKMLSVSEAREYSKKLIRQRANEKS